MTLRQGATKKDAGIWLFGWHVTIEIGTFSSLFTLDQTVEPSWRNLAQPMYILRERGQLIANELLRAALRGPRFLLRRQIPGE